MNRLILILFIALGFVEQGIARSPRNSGPYVFEDPYLEIEVEGKNFEIAEWKISSMEIFGDESKSLSVHFFHDGFTDSILEFNIVHGKRRLQWKNVYVYNHKAQLIQINCIQIKGKKSEITSTTKYDYDEVGRCVKMVSENELEYAFDSIAYNAEGYVIRKLRRGISRWGKKKDWVDWVEADIHFVRKEGSNVILIDSVSRWEKITYTVNAKNEVFKISRGSYVDTVCVSFIDSLNYCRKYYRNNVLKREMFYQNGNIQYDRVAFVRSDDKALDSIAFSDTTLTGNWHDSNYNLYFDYNYFYDNMNNLLMMYDNRYLVHQNIVVYEYDYRGMIVVQRNVLNGGVVHFKYKYEK